MAEDKCVNSTLPSKQSESKSDQSPEKSGPLELLQKSDGNRKLLHSQLIFNSYTLTLYEASGDYGHGSLLSCHNPSPNLFPHTSPPKS